MSYKEKPLLRLYKYENNSFVQIAIIDDYQEVSFENNLYEAGQFSITINFNIPNSQLFQRGLFVQFGDDSHDFGEISKVQDVIDENGKISQLRVISGHDVRYILKRRIIKNMNSNGLWVMTGKGEIVLRNLIKDQCGSGAEAKRRLPITNVIPASADAIGKEFSVSEQFTNLYEVCRTIATQSEIGWRIAFNGTLSLECFSGTDRSQTVQFSTSFDSLANGEFSDSSESFSNAIYIGGKGQNDDRDIYEGEDGSPEGLDRFESWDNQSSMTTESEYEAEALSMLTQYGQTVLMSGNGLAKSPYVYKEQYNVGDWITVAFSGKSAVVQILSVTEHWVWGTYDIQFAFGKPQPTQSDQLQLMLRKIQSASNKSSSTDSIRWYTIPTDTAMPKADVTYNTIGFIGTCAEGGSTFKLYLDNEKTGAKTYHVYIKQLAGTSKLKLTTGKSGATDIQLDAGTYVVIIYVDENGNIRSTYSENANYANSAGSANTATSATTAETATTASSCSGNSATATTARNARNTIAWCTTDSATSAKKATLEGYVLTSGDRIPLYITTTNTSATTLTLNVNNTGAKTIRINGSLVTSSTRYQLPAGLYMANYDGTYWNLYNLVNMSGGTSFNGSASAITLNASYGAIGVKAWYMSTTASYIVFTNGLKIQCGVANKTGTSGTDRIITKNFNIAFTQPPCFTFTPYFSAGSSTSWYTDVTSISASSFTVNTRRNIDDVPIRWIAIGY